MKGFVFYICVLLVLGHSATEISSVLSSLFPSVKGESVDLFLSPTFKYKLPVYWYMKFAADDMLFVILFFVLAKISLKVNVDLFIVCSIFFLYHVVDTFFFWWDFKSGKYEYWLSLAACSIGAIAISIPRRYKMKIVR